ncbi:hypothetical protein DFH27DRAFT_477648 [Peziza echinospora]|nr:hypothetical protein DFH27DRAFT_477648 [Peziza echinospora]
MATYGTPLKGKLAIVTGGSRGIGEAIAENLAAKGCDLVLNYNSSNSAERTATLADRLSKTYNITAQHVQADMGTHSGPATVIAFTNVKFGGSEGSAHINPATGELQIDIIINNAGVSHNKYIHQCTVEDFHTQYNINVLGPLLLIQAALPFLPTDRSGRIVNISSVSASQGFEAQSVYGGTKAALEAMTRTWARELKEYATVNAVNPGPVDTDMYGTTTPHFKENLRPFIEHTPLAVVGIDAPTEEETRELRLAGGRSAKPEEIAGVVGMLCSAESGWCTGSVVCANGGMAFST